MITAISYVCNRDSLGDVPEEDFAEAFENEFRAVEKFRGVALTVTFSDTRKGGVATITDDEDAARHWNNAPLFAEIDAIAERAFKFATTAHDTWKNG